MQPELPAIPVRDQLGRPLESLRVSVTDRCNLRCLYCMPEEEYTWLPRAELLTFEELAKLADVFSTLGVRQVRLTGGEPLMRQDLHRLVAMIAENARVRDIALTTNGVLLDEQAERLRDAGLHRVTVSLDTLRPDRFRTMTRRDDHSRVLAGIYAARRAGFTGTKLDAVIVRGVNDDELIDLIEFARANAAEIRFIEYMDVAGATQWSMERVVSRAEMLQRLEQRYGKITPASENANSAAPAERFILPDGSVFGIIASTTAPFCRTCNRSRLTADGQWYRCLYATSGMDLRGPLRAGASTAELTELISGVWGARTDRGAEQRKAERFRGAFVGIDELRRDPHLEMHTRGG
jgi:cyclic pyranopterin phosphate synthase